MNLTSDRIWNLIESLEASAPPLDEMKQHALLCGVLEAAGRLLSPPAVNGLHVDYKIGAEYFSDGYDQATGESLVPYFHAGFTAFLICTDQSLKGMRGRVAGWK